MNLERLQAERSGHHRYVGMPLPDPDRGPEFKANGEVEPVPDVSDP
jgi:hypothetical protein